MVQTMAAWMVKVDEILKSFALEQNSWNLVTSLHILVHISSRVFVTLSLSPVHLKFKFTRPRHDWQRSKTALFDGGATIDKIIIGQRD